LKQKIKREFKEDNTSVEATAVNFEVSIYAQGLHLESLRADERNIESKRENNRR
jgi:hypothetical protein